MIKVHINQSKADFFSKGVNLHLGKTSTLVREIVSYLGVRGSQSGPLCMTGCGKTLTRQSFSIASDSTLTKLHLDNGSYNKHSFCIGAMIFAMEAWIPETQIKMLERWQSDVSQGYVRTPPADIARLSSGRDLSANFPTARHDSRNTSYLTYACSLWLYCLHISVTTYVICA